MMCVHADTHQFVAGCMCACMCMLTRASVCIPPATRPISPRCLQGAPQHVACLCMCVCVCVQQSHVACRLPAALANIHNSFPNAGGGIRWKDIGGYSIYVVAASVANPLSPFELTVFPNRECASTSSLQVCVFVCLCVRVCVFTCVPLHARTHAHYRVRASTPTPRTSCLSNGARRKSKHPATSSLRQLIPLVIPS